MNCRGARTLSALRLLAAIQDSLHFHHRLIRHSAPALPCCRRPLLFGTSLLARADASLTVYLRQYGHLPVRLVKSLRRRPVSLPLPEPNGSFQLQLTVLCHVASTAWRRRGMRFRPIQLAVSPLICGLMGTLCGPPYAGELIFAAAAGCPTPLRTGGNERSPFHRRFAVLSADCVHGCAAG
jgi:hypothetical protein